jgi:transposase
MMNHELELVYAGVDTHADTHHVAVIGAHGRELGDTQVPATAAGYRRALAFLARWPGVVEVGVECTGSYGAALTRELRAAGYAVIEVNRPNRFDRRAHGRPFGPHAEP